MTIFHTVYSHVKKHPEDKATMRALMSWRLINGAKTLAVLTLYSPILILSTLNLLVFKTFEIGCEAFNAVITFVARWTGFYRLMDALREDLDKNNDAICELERSRRVPYRVDSDVN